MILFCTSIEIKLRKCSKTSLYITNLRAWNELGWEGLMDKPRGPKTKSKRTPEVVKRILDLRLKNPEKDMYDIAEMLKEEGHKISARSVARVLSDHGITLKKTKKLPFSES